MGSGIEWGLWIAACTLIVSAAKFVDEYHITNSIKSRARDGLIKIFLFLDRPQIANFPAALYGYLAATLKRIGRTASIVVAFVAYFAIVASFYVGAGTLVTSLQTAFWSTH